MVASESIVIKQPVRRFHKKTRTGCKTCKVRRVKCDEGRPQCRRCIEFGATCDGYVSLTNPSSSAPPRRNILPKNHNLAPQLFRILPLPRRSDSEQESYFFRFYCEDLATHLSGPFKTTLWERLIPQLSEAEPFVRHAVVGIGALNQVYRGHKPRKGKTLEPLSYRAPEFEKRQRSMYEFALKEYDKALKGMRRAIENQRRDIRTALVACLLVFCFESLQGNLNAAVSNAQSGLTLMYEYIVAKSPYCGMSYRSPSYLGIEQDILNAFSGLDVQVLLFLDTRTADVHRAVISRLEFTVAKMPQEFENLEEAMSFWLMMQRRNYHFNIIAIEALSDSAVSARKHNPLYNKDRLDNSVGSRDVYEDEFPDTLEDSESAYKAALRRQMVRYVEDVYRLTEACAPVFEQVEASGSKKERIVMALLKIHANLNHIQLAGAFMVKDTEYDAYLPEYTRIVELSEEIYPYLAQESDSMYRFFLGIVYPLSAVGFRCRNSHIRGRAIDLLQRGPYREGIWDAMSVGHLTDWIRRVEEEGMDENGFIPENKRAVMTLCDIDVNIRTAVLGCRGVGERGMKFRKEVIQWEHHIGSQSDTMRLGEDTEYSAKFRVKDGSSVSGGPLRLGKLRRDEGAYDEW